MAPRAGCSQARCRPAAARGAAARAPPPTPAARLQYPLGLQPTPIRNISKIQSQLNSVGPVWPICAANSELLFAADQLCAARLLRPQNLKRRHGAFWIEHSLQVGQTH